MEIFHLFSFHRTMEAIEMQFERSLPRHSGGHSGIDDGTKDTDLWRHCYFRLRGLVADSHHAIHTVIRGHDSVVGAGYAVTSFEGRAHCQQFVFVQYALCYLQAIHSREVAQASEYIHPSFNSIYVFGFCQSKCMSFFQQIFFHGKDYKNLRAEVGDQCVPKRYNGNIDIPEGIGSGLADLFQVYSKDFESMSTIPICYSVSSIKYIHELMFVCSFVSFQWPTHSVTTKPMRIQRCDRSMLISHT